MLILRIEALCLLLVAAVCVDAWEAGKIQIALFGILFLFC